MESTAIVSRIRRPVRTAAISAELHRSRTAKSVALQSPLYRNTAHAYTFIARPAQHIVPPPRVLRLPLTFNPVRTAQDWHFTTSAGLSGHDIARRPIA